MKKRRICIIYTGGTIGMIPSERGYIPSSGAFRQLLRAIPDLYWDAMPEWDVVEFDPLLDSSDVAVREEYHRRRDTVVRKLHEIPGVVCECPKGAFYLMAALPVDDAEKFQQWLLEEFDDHGDTVMFAAGGPFYATPGKGLNEIRIAYVLKQEDLERAMDLLALGIQKYNETHK